MRYRFFFLPLGITSETKQEKPSRQPGLHPSGEEWPRFIETPDVWFESFVSSLSETAFFMKAVKMVLFFSLVPLPFICVDAHSLFPAYDVVVSSHICVTVLLHQRLEPSLMIGNGAFFELGELSLYLSPALSFVSICRVNAFSRGATGFSFNISVAVFISNVIFTERCADFAMQIRSCAYVCQGI